MEQIDLEVLALTMDAHDPERLEKTAASSVEAAGRLFSFNAQALLGGCRVAAHAGPYGGKPDRSELCR